MKNGILLSIALTALIATNASARYRGLDREWESYQPPAIFQSGVQARTPAEAPPVLTEGDKDFQAQVARLQELKEKWEKALRMPGVEPSFYVPEPSRLERLQGAATNAALTEKVLGNGFSLEDLEVLSFIRNPDVQAKEREFRGTIEAYSQVQNLDEILRQYTAFTASLMTGVGNMENSESIALRFPFPGVLALKGEVVTQEIRAAWEDLEISKRAALTSARKAYWNLLYTRRAEEITDQMLTLLDGLKKSSSARYEAGQANFQDVIRVNIEKEKLKEERRTLTEERQNLEAQVREILALPPSAQVGRPASRNPSHQIPALKELYPLAVERRQEIKRMRAMIGKMERMIEMAETMIYPRFTLGFSFYERDEVSRVGSAEAMSDSFPVTTTASMGEGLPKMPWFGTNDAYLRETKQKLEGLKKDLQMTEASTMFGVREVWFRLDRAKREESLYGERVVTLSQAALEASTTGYSAGRVSFSDVNESYAGWLNANLSLERSRADLGIGQAELQEAVGSAWK
jgi:cobalt-zinc-cadmium efflux system outer membrane protein